MVYIVGYGAMAQALIEGFLQRGIEVAIVGRNSGKRELLSKRYQIPSFDLEDFDISDKEILLAVKPHALEEVAAQLRGEAEVLYSILAGVSIENLKLISALHYIRAMPNIAAAYGSSMTALTGDEQFKERAIELFEAIGEIIWLESEEKLEVATAIAGSGPAFLAMVAEAIADGGVACGLRRDEAYQLSAGLFRSYGALSGELPSSIKDRVMSPAGTTARGVRELERGGIRSHFFEAVVAASKKR
ncbi:MAG: pyrroline-5-carboxylate reductase [Epsilonproteobacteria bacterium]|nr:pyrroline-5-carboxylate reductase [Campylobacterota bacterium]NPA57470.1 pyrroline-5-carboxylate reductase [Campylobacterota bacterium]